MCLAAAIPLAAGGLQAYGQIRAGNENNRIARENARLLELEAADTRVRAASDGEVIRSQFGQVVGQQRAGLSAANVDISRGSAANLSADTAAVGELEVLRTITNAAREAYGLRTQARNTLVEGRRAQQAGYLSAGATLLSAGADTFGQLRQPGGAYAGRGGASSARGSVVRSSSRGMTG